MPKSNGSLRPFIHIKALNSFLVHRHNKREGLRNAKRLFKPGLLDGKDRFMKRLLYCSR
jgi:hypothetical protein